MNLVLFRKEAAAIFRYGLSIPSRYLNLLRQGETPHFIASSLILILSALASLKIHLPSLNVDVWVHHIPIAESIVNNKGFIYPIIPHLNYGNMPSFVELLFAEGLVLTNNYSIAGAIHFFIFFSFLLLLGSFSGKNKTIALVLLSWILMDPFFDAFTPMNDTALACFAAASIFFLVMYSRDKQSYYLFFSSLLCGAALSSKYLGLLTLFVYGVILLLQFTPDKNFLKKAGVGLFGIFLVCGFWYGKNAIIYKNPVYPYFFGHPGISDEWMADTIRDQRQSFDPAFRNYSRDILSFAGWRDFAKATYIMFFNPSVFPVMLVVAVAALVFARNRTNLLMPVSVLYFILWYFFVFHHSRYGASAYLLFLTGFYFCALSLTE